MQHFNRQYKILAECYLLVDPLHCGINCFLLHWESKTENELEKRWSWIKCYMYRLSPDQQTLVWSVMHCKSERWGKWQWLRKQKPACTCTTRTYAGLSWSSQLRWQFIQQLSGLAVAKVGMGSGVDCWVQSMRQRRMFKTYFRPINQTLASLNLWKGTEENWLRLDIFRQFTKLLLANISWHTTHCDVCFMYDI